MASGQCVHVISVEKHPRLGHNLQSKEDLHDMYGTQYLCQRIECHACSRRATQIRTEVLNEAVVLLWISKARKEKKEKAFSLAFKMYLNSSRYMLFA